MVAPRFGAPKGGDHLAGDAFVAHVLDALGLAKHCKITDAGSGTITEVVVDGEGSANFG
jgi:hypothetical protein